MRFLLLKALLMAAILVIISLPFFPSKLKFSLSSMSYKKEERWKNILFVAESFVLSTVLLCITSLLKQFYLWFFNLKFMLKLLDGASVRNNYITEVIVILLSNIAAGIIFIVAKKIFRYILDTKVFTKQNGNIINKKPNAAKKQQTNENKQDRSENRLRSLRQNSVLVFDENNLKENEAVIVSDYLSKPDKSEGNSKAQTPDKAEKQPESFMDWFRYILKKVVGLFYSEKDNFEYVNTGTYRWAKELKLFLVFVAVFYIIVLLLMQLPVFFTLEKTSWLNKVALWLVNNTYMYPMLSLVFLFELLGFIDGEHKAPEETEQPQISIIRRDNEEKNVDYDEVKTSLLDKYSSRYNIKNFDASAMAGKSAYNIAEKDKAIQNIAKSIRSKKGFVNGDYMQSIEYMLDGKHVLFDSSLYSALGEYVVYYLFVTLSFGKRALFICKDAKEIENSTAYLEDRFRQITKSSGIFWRFSTFEQLHEGKNPDILFLTPEQFLEKSLFTDGKDFFDELTDVFVLDADKIITANNYYCLIIAKKLAKAVSQSPFSSIAPSVRYSFFSSGHIQSVNNSLRQFFNLEDAPLEAFHSFGMASNTDVFVWHTGMESTLYVDNGANQVALEVQIAKDSSNFGINNISLISDTSVYSSQINEIQGLILNGCDLTDNPVGYVVVADDGFNLPNSIYNYSRFSGRKSSVLHVVSKPYLLRDYFTDKAEDYVAHFELIGHTMSEHAQATKANTIILLCDAVNGIEREEFIKRASELLGKSSCCCDTLKFEDCIKLCYQTAFNTDAYYEPEYSLEQKTNAEHETKTYIYLKDSEKMFEKLLESTSTVKIEYTNTQSVENTAVFKDEIIQHFLPGQTVTRNNRNYTIKDIIVDRGVIILDDTGSSINVPSDYIQTRLYNINSAESASHSNHSYRAQNSIVNQLSMSIYNADITVDTVGYYSIENAVQTVDLVKPNFAKYVYIGNDEELAEKIRRNISTKMLVLELDTQTENSPHATYMLSVIMQEFMKTVFPHQYRCISVCPVFEDSVDEEEFFKDEAAVRDLYPRIVGDFFRNKDKEVCEDTETESTENIEENEPVTGGKIRIAIIEDIQGGNGVVETLAEANGIMITNLLHVVSDYLAWLRSKNNQASSYLKFGYEKLPGIFNSDELEKIVKQFRHSIERSELVRLRDKNICFFCHCELNSDQAVQLEDGRVICEKCCESSVNTFEELDTCLAEVIDSIKNSTSVPETIPSDLRADFVSTEEIRQRYSDRNTVPIAYRNYTSRQLFVEYGLPKAAVYTVLAQLITETWQDDNIINDGNDLLDVQHTLVEIQTLHTLKKPSEAEALEQLNESNELLNELKKLLNEAGSQDSFAYFLGSSGKQNRPEEPTPVSTDKDIAFVAERDPATLPRFYFNMLDDTEKEIYNLIYKNISEFADSSGPLPSETSFDRCSEITSMVTMDNPHFYWCANPTATFSVDSNNNVKNIIYKYCMNANEVKRRNKQIEKAVKPFISGIKESMSDYTVALLAHENIIKLIDYDTVGLDLQEKDTDHYSKPDNLRSIYGVFVDEKAVCAGYAKAYQYLLNRMGIECTYVRGVCNGGGRHGWNLVKLEGDYYYVDVTHDDSSDTDPKRNGGNEISYDYFCITTEELLKTRKIDNAERYPVCTATKCNYYVKSNMYFKEYDAQRINKAIVSEIKSGKKIISLKAENEKVFRTICNRLVENHGMHDILNSLNDSGAGTSYLYSKREEFNILHIHIN